LTLLGTFVDPAWIATSGDAPVLSPVFVGTLNGKTVIAVPATAPASDNNASEGLSGLDIANLVIGIIGVISSIVTIVGGVLAVRAYARNKIARGQNLSNKDKAVAEEGAKRVMDKLAETYGDQLGRVGSRSQIVEDGPMLVSESLELRPKASSTVQKVRKAKALKTIDDTVIEMDRIAELSSSSKLSDIETKLVLANEMIDSNPLGSARKMKESAESLKEVLKESKGSISAQEFERSQEAIETVETQARVVEEIEKAKVKEIENGEEKQVEEGLPEEK
jgi:hypothetical protein